MSRLLYLESRLNVIFSFFSLSSRQFPITLANARADRSRREAGGGTFLINKNCCVTRARRGMTSAAGSPCQIIRVSLFFSLSSSSPRFFSRLILRASLEENRPRISGEKVRIYVHTHIHIHIYSSNSSILNKKNSPEESRTASRERLLNLRMYIAYT